MTKEKAILDKSRRLKEKIDSFNTHNISNPISIQEYIDFVYDVKWKEQNYNILAFIIFNEYVHYYASYNDDPDSLILPSWKNLPYIVFHNGEIIHHNMLNKFNNENWFAYASVSYAA